MIAFTAAIEPLRAVNRISRKTLYTWQTLGLTAHEVAASNDVNIKTDLLPKDTKAFDAIFVCSGTRPRHQLSPKLRDSIRHIARTGTPLGAVCTGSVALADAGVLSGHKCTIHWENLEGFKEEYPKLDITATLFEIDRDRYTCSGGTAPLDMMLHCVKLDHGPLLARNVAEQLLHNTVREPEDGQRMAIEQRTGITHPKLLAAIGIMEVFLENPLQLERIADKVGLSLRQLERLFKEHLETTPGRYYLWLRMKLARQLLRQTSMSVLEISIATGFSSSAHFASRYKSAYGHTPMHERK